MSALAPYAHADRLRLGIVLAYPPRLAGAAVAIALAVAALSGRAHRSALVATACALLFVASAGWGGGTGRPDDPPPTDALTLLTYNVHNQPSAAEFTAAQVRREHVDILMLQEVRLPNRKLFIAALPEFEFFWADPAKLPERNSTGVFASMIALRRQRFENLADAEVLTGITGYRTFAVRTMLNARPIWIVNVHATKPFWLEEGLVVLITDAPAKARWHQEEAAQLSRWIGDHASLPMIVAGDFNAPGYADAMPHEDISSAHASVGHGPHLTFPTILPIWGIDHILGNAWVRFYEYRALEGGPSDHLAQIARFGLLPEPTHSDRRTRTDALGPAYSELRTQN